MKKLITISLGMMLVSASALAAASATNSDQSATGGNGRTATPTVSSHYRMAILDGQADAAAVLGGGQPSDLFIQARAAVEATLGVQFQTDREAAIALMILAESPNK